MKNLKDEECSELSLELEPIFGRCSIGGEKKYLAELKWLPETEQAIRDLALHKISFEEFNALNPDLDTMLCENCMKKELRNRMMKRFIK